MTKTRVSQPAEKPRLIALNGRIPYELYQRLEGLRHTRSMTGGQRVSQRDLLIEALEDLLRKKGTR